MVLGDRISRLSDERSVNETLFSLGDLPVAAGVVAIAGDNGMAVPDFAMESVGRFVNGASDDEWLALMGQMSRADDPGEVFPRCVLSKTVSASQDVGRPPTESQD